MTIYFRLPHQPDDAATRLLTSPKIGIENNLVVCTAHIRDIGRVLFRIRMVWDVMESASVILIMGE